MQMVPSPHPNHFKNLIPRAFVAALSCSAITVGSVHASCPDDGFLGASMTPPQNHVISASKSLLDQTAILPPVQFAAWGVTGDKVTSIKFNGGQGLHGAGEAFRVLTTDPNLAFRILTQKNKPSSPSLQPITERLERPFSGVFISQKILSPVKTRTPIYALSLVWNARETAGPPDLKVLTLSSEDVNEFRDILNRRVKMSQWLSEALAGKALVNNNGHRSIEFALQQAAFEQASFLLASFARRDHTAEFLAWQELARSWTSSYELTSSFFQSQLLAHNPNLVNEPMFASNLKLIRALELLKRKNLSVTKESGGTIKARLVAASKAPNYSSPLTLIEALENGLQKLGYEWDPQANDWVKLDTKSP